jgi:23S rRNA (adenine2503-C2)-methyltransferase
MDFSFSTLYGMFPEEIAAAFSLEPFRGRQIFKWLCKGAQSFDGMTNLSAALRKILTERCASSASRNVASARAKDGTVKLRVEFDKDAAVESVILRDEKGRKTACLSSQAGCALACAFCQTGRLGFKRNLSAAEIIEQFFLLQAKARGQTDLPFSNIVFMGMGEPLLNLAAVRKAIAVLCHKDGLALSMRRITISTAGITRGIYDLADNGPAVRLAVSVTACDDSLRAQLMPCAARDSLDELQKALCYWRKKTGNRPTLEAALLAGVNTDNDAMGRLALFARRVDAHVNLIPWNPVRGLPFSRPKTQESTNALIFLQNEGVNATLRMSRGGDVAGACGQLGLQSGTRNSGYSAE